jgi:hypothetical protein
MNRIPETLQHIEAYCYFTTPQSGLTMKLTGRDVATAEELETAVLGLIEYLATANSRSFFEDEFSPKREEARAQYRARLAKEMRETLQPTREGDEITLSTAGKASDFRLQARWMIGNITSVTLPIFDMYRSTRKHAETERLWDIALAMHNYHDTFNHFPPGPEAQGEAKSGLSWRVHLLPFLGENQLYNEFKMDEPWDSEHNLKLVEKMPLAYAPRGQAAPVAEGTTRLQLPLGQGLPGSAERRIRFADLLDGSSNTIMVVESPAEKAVIWTKPADLVIDLENPAASLAGAEGEGFNAVMYDGSVRQIPGDVDNQTLKAWLTHAGGEVVP